MKSVLLVAIGGSCGALCRWGMSAWIDQLRGGATSFPLGIFAANVLGCFLFGLVFGLSETRGWIDHYFKLALLTGFLGSFTTFSTFGWNTLELLKNGQTGIALLNVGLSVVIGLAGVWSGYALAMAFR